MALNGAFVFMEIGQKQWVPRARTGLHASPGGHTYKAVKTGFAVSRKQLPRRQTVHLW